MDEYYDQVIEDGGEDWLRRVPGYPPYEQRAVWERACVDVFDRRAGFCKIHHVGGEGSVFVNSLPDSNSPSRKLWENPELGCIAARSTFMMETTFTSQGGIFKKFGFTGFTVAPCLGLTAGHCVDEWDFSGYRGKLLSMKGCKGGFIPPGCFRINGFDCSHLWSVNSMKGCSPASTFPVLAGADLSLFFVNGQCADEFLLPASPEYEDCTEVTIYSYPHVTLFMADARKQLKEGIVAATPFNDIWEAYKAAMHVRAQKLKSQATKDELFHMLEDTFCGFSTGQKVASPGSICELTTAAIKGRYSTLGGSSGAPVCPLMHPRYFIGVHDSACKDSDVNIATSCDNPEFVAAYKKQVLPMLPSSHEAVWKSFDTRPFEHWCIKHGVCWGQSRQEKRKREDDDGLMAVAKSPMTPTVEATTKS